MREFNPDRDLQPDHPLGVMLDRWLVEAARAREGSESNLEKPVEIDIQIIFTDGSMSGGRCRYGDQPFMFVLRQPAIVQRGNESHRVPGKDVEIYFHASDIKRLVRIVDAEPESGIVVPAGAAGPRRIFTP